MSTKWNRSSALNPEQIGLVTTVTAQTIQDAIARFEKAVDISTLTEAQLAEAVCLISEGVAAELAKALEDWKSGVPTIDRGSF
ncbi:MAG: hypothetical protein LAO08_18470 [Acidobacteriia bacterium]|nr:hypothetical protein [Terriglobia bacterium]